MLLTQLHRRGCRHARARARGERGSALASVVAVLAIAGIVTAALLASTAQGSSTASAGRAHVQSLQAAEGGLDAAKATLATCGADPVTSAVGASPRFSTEIWYRQTEQGAWQRGCPLADSVQVKLVSTGWSDAKALSGQAQSDVSTMESVVRKVPLVFAGRDLTLNSPLTAHAAGRADVVVNRDYRCNGSATLTHTGMFFLGAGQYASGACLTQGFTRTGADYDAASATNAYPRLTTTDARFSHLGTPVRWFDIPNPNNPGFYPPCQLTGAGTGYYTITGSGAIDTQTNCPQGLTVDPNWTLEFVLTGDVVVYVDSFTVLGKVKVRSGDGKEHSLSVVRPWSQSQGCTGVADMRFTGGTIEQLSQTRLMLYTSNTLQLGTDVAGTARPAHTIRGQVYGCDVAVWDPTTLVYAPAGGTATPRPWSAVELLSKRDQAG